MPYANVEKRVFKASNVVLLLRNKLFPLLTTLFRAEGS